MFFCQVQQQYQPIISNHGGTSSSSANQLTSGDGCSSAETHTTTTTTLLQIKREPCQVSEVTTSNNLGHCTPGASYAGNSGTLIKIEQKSPNNCNTSATALASITSTMDSAAHNNNVLANGQNNSKLWLLFSLEKWINID